MLRILFYVFLLLQQGCTKDIHDSARIMANLLESNGVVAFSAELSANAELAGGSTIIFDHEITNAGELYFPNSGQFACVDDGLYVFFWSSMKHSVTEFEGMRCITKLRKGGTDYKFGPKTSYYSTYYSGVAEMTAVLQCSTSPPTAITVVTVPYSEELGMNSVYHFLSSFSGFQLNTTIAFTVKLSHDQYLFEGSRIRFGDIISNFGIHYDDTNHRFRCPDNGVYSFSVSTHTSDPSTPWSVARMVLEKEVILLGPMTFIATNEYDSGSASTTAIVQCTEDFSVYVEAQASNDFPHNSYSASLTSFTGFKLYDVIEGAVAFTVIATQNQTITTANQKILFDKVVTNIGNAFDEAQSHFLCPDNDYYLFTWGSAATYEGGHTNIELLQDDSRVSILYLTPTSGESDITHTSGSSSKSVITQCSATSKFTISGSNVNDNRVYLAHYTTFSGYKVPGQ